VPESTRHTKTRDVQPIGLVQAYCRSDPKSKVFAESVNRSNVKANSIIESISGNMTAPKTALEFKPCARTASRNEPAATITVTNADVRASQGRENITA
jgi:hypothetical protein